MTSNPLQLQEQLFRFEAEQTQALQQEDFERAERLNERIEGLPADRAIHRYSSYSNNPYWVS